MNGSQAALGVGSQAVGEGETLFHPKYQRNSVGAVNDATRNHITEIKVEPIVWDSTEHSRENHPVACLDYIMISSSSEEGEQEKEDRTHTEQSSRNIQPPSSPHKAQLVVVKSEAEAEAETTACIPRSVSPLEHEGVCGGVIAGVPVKVEEQGRHNDFAVSPRTSSLPEGGAGATDTALPSSSSVPVPGPVSSSRQFWHAGDYETSSHAETGAAGGAELDRVRVHPKFLHSNATSHKWALGALAELLDNSVDEVGNGATFCSVDMVASPNSTAQPMLVVEDNGGGMDPARLRACMSLGYSHKSKKANTIGQYGNGFKTSTMRLGADALVFTRTTQASSSSSSSSCTQSIGLLSFTFLKDTGRNDIVVPMIDFVRQQQQVAGGKAEQGQEHGDWLPLFLPGHTRDTWQSNLETLTSWTPFSSLQQLMEQFKTMGSHGTRVLVYNLWQADDGQLELDFLSDPTDIQLRGARDERYVKMAESGKYPNSHHFLTYKHSLRSYASILYLRLPAASFTLILRGVPVPPHSLVSDLMHCQEVVYRPKTGAAEDTLGMMACVTLGFVKDAKEHVEVQGFCVYHKNRLIKPFWRLWNAAGSQGRGVVGVLEANFVEPAHDKQGFERTEVLRRLEDRLLKAQKAYWNRHAHLVGYVTAASHRKGAAVGAGAGEERGGGQLGNEESRQPDTDPALASGAGVFSNSRKRSVSAMDDPPYRPSTGGSGRGAQVHLHAPEQKTSAEETIDTWLSPLGSSQDNEGRALQRVVDADWLGQLVEENRDLKDRCMELEKIVEVGKSISQKLIQAEQEVFFYKNKFFQLLERLKAGEQNAVNLVDHPETH